MPKNLCAALADMGIRAPSIAQSASIPLLLEGKNVAIQSHTGSGKTFAYLLPILTSILSDEARQQWKESGGKSKSDSGTSHAIIVAPSQELAMQIVRQIERCVFVE